MDNLLIISLTIGSSGPFTLLSLSLALACSTKSIVISVLRPSSVSCCFPFFLKCSILLSCASVCFLLISVHLLLRRAFETSSSSHSSLSSVNCPFTFCQRLSFGLFFTGCQQLALMACFLNIFLRYLLCISPRLPTSSDTLWCAHYVIFSLSAFAWRTTLLAAVSIFLRIMSRSSAVPSFFSTFFFRIPLFHLLF